MFGRRGVAALIAPLYGAQAHRSAAAAVTAFDVSSASNSHACSRLCLACRSTVMPETLLGIRSDDQGRTETIAPGQEDHLPALCAKVHARVTAFLAAQPSTDRLRGVQEQTRLSLKVLEEALERYRLVVHVVLLPQIRLISIQVSLNCPSHTTAARTVWSSSFSISPLYMHIQSKLQRHCRTDWNPSTSCRPIPSPRSRTSYNYQSTRIV